jgi:putative ABC transport system permease protein
MILNYIKITFRFIARNISFTIINLVGLTAGITAFLLIALYLQNELRYDTDAPYGSRLYRLVGVQEPSGLDPQHVAITSAVFAPQMLESFPQVEDAFRIMYPMENVIMIGEKSFRGGNVFFSERNVIRQMGMKVLHGDPLLMQPHQAALNRTSAERFFNTSDVVGKTLRLGEKIYTITSVFDNEDQNLHLKADIFLSLSTVENDLPWLQMPGNNTLTTYVLLNEPGEVETFEKQMNDLYKSFDNGSEHFMKNTFYLQEYNDIYLRSGNIKFHMYTSEGNINNIYIFSIVALLILVIACINFINLSTANSARRAREVGLRKLLGADRIRLAAQFIGESLFITLFSIIIALGLTELILPKFNSLLEANLKIDFTGNTLFNLGLVIILISVGMVSGFYPAVYLSRFEAATVLRAGSTSGKPRSSLLRKVLVTFQFAISTAMILATLVVINQVRHMKNKDLGYNHENVFTIFNSQSREYEKLKAFSDRLLTFPEIISAGISSGFHGVAGRQSMIETADSVPARLMVRYGYVDPGFFTSMQMKFVEGRNFSFDHFTDPERTMIINRAAQKALGWENPVGMRIRNHDVEEIDFYQVIGVIEDYHYFSLHNPIEPAVYIWRPGEMGVINVRYQTSDPHQLLNKIEKEYEAFFPGHYFHADYLVNLLSRQYRSESNTMQIFLWFAVLCILISCLGLFGLTSFMVNQRRKEISIRKVLGSSLLHINILLLKNFMQWIGIAALIALPVTFIIMTRWLENFAYHISIGFNQIFMTLILIIMIAASTILVLSTRAAMRNPAENIKYE